MRNYENKKMLVNLAPSDNLQRSSEAFLAKYGLHECILEWINNSPTYCWIMVTLHLTDIE